MSGRYGRIRPVPMYSIFDVEILVRHRYKRIVQIAPIGTDPIEVALRSDGVDA